MYRGGGMANSTTVQRQQIHEYLKINGSASTFDLRNTLDIMHPAGRIFELRKKGIKIKTIKINQASPQGELHKVAYYILKQV